MPATETGRSLSRSSAKPYLWAIGLLWVLPLVLIVCGYFGMWLLYFLLRPEDPSASDRVDPGFLVLAFGLLAYPIFVVTGLVVVGGIVLRQLWNRAQIRRQEPESARSP